ncbi:MAG: class I SAM-dependent methyltransferase [Gaiellaceae bacterium]|jgi:SAM-dependent methyltransferase
MNYELAYRIGFHPWEDAEAHSPFVEKFSELIDEEESGRESPYGAALDLGTGSGIWAIQLAKRGWQVTGVDLVEKALRRAEERVKADDVAVKLVHGDVTKLSSAGVGSGYRLVLDTGTFHGLRDHQRTAMGKEVDSVAAPDATLLMLVWPRRRRPLIRGVDRGGIEEAFPGWTVTDVGPSHFQAPKPIEVLLRPNEHWYRLRRSG